MNIGRAWKSSELRLKSFDDLHKLWYVLLKEKNALLTEYYDCESRNVAMTHPERLHKVKMEYERLNAEMNQTESRIPSTPSLE